MQWFRRRSIRCFAAWRLIWRSIRCLEVNLEVNSLFGGQFGCPFAVWRSIWRSIHCLGGQFGGQFGGGGQFGCPFAVWRSIWRSIHCLGGQFGGQFATPRARLGRRPGFTRGCRNSGKRKLCGLVPGPRKLETVENVSSADSSSTLGQFGRQFTI